MTQALTTTADAALVVQTEERVNALMKTAEAYLEPVGIDPKFFAQVTVTALLKDSHLLESCDVESFNAALFKCAQRGMLPDGESAVIVPFGQQATLIPMVGGLLDSIRRNVPGCAVESRIVMTWDRFQLELGSVPIIRHGPESVPSGMELKELDNPKNFRGAWCIITMPAMARGAEPVKEHHYMTKEEIDKVRSRVKGNRNPTSAWVRFARRMYEKTVIRAAARKLPSRHQLFANFDSSVLDEYTSEAEGPPPPPVAGLKAPKSHRI